MFLAVTLQEVCRLYRSALRLLNSWAIDREVFLDEAEKIRNEFDAHKDLPVESGKTKYLIRAAKEKMVEYSHPDKYIPAYMPGGSLFMRNPPLPLDVCYPHGIPAEVQKEMGDLEFDIDMSYAKKGKGAKDGMVLVDSANKTHY